MLKKIDKIMKPKSIAVIGASARKGTIGSEIISRIKEYEFQGDVYPVNPKGGEIMGYKTYTSVSEIQGEVDFAIIIVRKDFVLDTLKQCQPDYRFHARCRLTNDRWKPVSPF